MPPPTSKAKTGDGSPSNVEVTAWPSAPNAVPSFSVATAGDDATEVFKHDARSRVWRWDDADGRGWVIKRFEHPAWKQRLTARLGRHPAQRETQWHGRLRHAGLPVVPVVASGVTSEGRHWLATPYVGPSLYNWLRHCDPRRDAQQRHDFTRQLARLTGQLLAMRVQHRDFKASNVVIAPKRTDAIGVSRGRLALIDAGACRGTKGIPVFGAALPMLLNLHRNLQDAATYHVTPRLVTPTRTDRLRFYRAMLEAWPSFPDGLQHLPRHPEFLAGFD